MALRDKKYDRQLRIWGDHGQRALEQSSICLLNCGPTGAEALKNLVLAGIGNFTIVDPSKVEAADLGNNFLVDWDSIGQSRAKAVCACLQELNEAVGAKFVEESPENLVQCNPGFFSRFTLIIATQMLEGALLKLDGICRQHNIVLLIGKSYGLTGLIRVSMREHCVIESKPDNTVDDLRLHKPWDDLNRSADEFDVNTNDSLIHKHIPYAVILIKAAQEWKESHGGLLPSTSKERAEFKALIASKKIADDEDNYREALASAYKVWSPPTISSELRQILDDVATKVTKSSADFWVMVAALKEFISIEGQGDSPLDGAIPDMTSLTEYYVNLQKIYQSKAETDVDTVEERVKNTLKQIGRDSNSITRATIKQFCKNARNIRVFRYSTLADEFSSKSGPELQKLLASEDNRDVSAAGIGAEVMGGEAKEKCCLSCSKNIFGNIYVLLRAVDSFVATYNRFPGAFDEDMEDDVARLKTIGMRLLGEMGCSGAVLCNDLVTEMCRYAGAEIHCVGSIIGGIVSQEAIKLLTKQFTPLSGTLIYNSIDSTTSVILSG